MSAPTQPKPILASLVICYHWDDRDVADEIDGYLTKLGAKVWFDKHIDISDEWRPEVMDRIRASDGIVVLLSASTMRSREVPKEVQCAENNDRRIFTIALGMFPTNEKLYDQLCLKNYKNGFEPSERLSICYEIINKISPQTYELPAVAPKTNGLNPADCPYLGPAAFREHQSELFFGRKDEIQKALNDLNAGTCRLLMIHGPSGTGKTSLLQAKLIPALRKSGYYTPSPMQIMEAKMEKEPDVVSINSADKAAESGGEQRGSNPGDRFFVSEDVTRKGGISSWGAVKEFLYQNRKPTTDDFKGVVIIFDQFEALFNKQYKNDVINDTFPALRNALDLLSDLKIIIVFREEYLGQINRLSRSRADGVNLSTIPQPAHIVLNPMNEKSAILAIRGPARVKGVDFELSSAERIARELRKVKVLVEGQPRKVDERNDIEQIQLQIVCKKLWENIEPGRKEINLVDVERATRRVLNSKKQNTPGEKDIVQTHDLEHTHIDSLLFFFISDVLDHFYAEVAKAVEKEENYPDKLLRMACLQFVSPSGHRLLLQKDNLGRVGRLPHGVVRVLEDKQFLRADERGTSTWYELAHDKLIEPVRKVTDQKTLKLLHAYNALSAAMRRFHGETSGFDGVFEEHDSILGELKEVRHEQSAFFLDESEFVFRSALRSSSHLKIDLDKQNQGSGSSLEEWAHVLINVDFGTFMKVMCEALTLQVSAEETLRLNAITLLRIPTFRAEFFDKHTSELRTLAELIQRLALGASDETRELASVAACELLPHGAVDQMFKLMHNGDQASQAQRAISCLRHAADRQEIKVPSANEEFEGKWQEIKSWDRARILSHLWFERTKHSFGWMLFVVVMATIFTAVFAGLAFIPMGFWGAALTLADKAGGPVKGAFHGIAGGTFWAIGISIALLSYWVILRGARVARKRQDWIPAAIFASLGGILGGLTLTVVLGFVFQNDSLYNAGWLCTTAVKSLPEKLKAMFLLTRYGWVTPIFGCAVGAGIAWCLQTITADPEINKYLQKDSSAIQEPKQVSNSIKTIVQLVAYRSWRVVAAVSLGGAAVLAILQPGPGVCDTNPSSWSRGVAVCASAHVALADMPPCEHFPKGQNADKHPVDKHPPLAPMLARVAGMVFIISAGGIFFQVGLLFGIFAARVGVKLQRDEHFLEPLDA